ncbi:MAG TPA: hypothetical protein EYH58_06980 [Aquifex aeolicus]|nr:hypothetical protein [Aquifex aeolicus]
MEDLKEILLKFLNGNLSQSEFKILKGFLVREIKKLSYKYNVELGENDVAHDFLIHIAKRAYHLEELIKTDRFSVGYLKTSLRNFVIDIVRKKIEEQSIEEILEKEEGKGFLERILSNPSKVIEYIELKEFVEKFNEIMEEEDVKILCYLYDKSYKCFWKNKTEAALYKHVSRNRNKVLEKLKKLVRELKVEEETLEEFIKKHLSGKCENLRFLYCKED